MKPAALIFVFIFITGTVSAQTVGEKPGQAAGKGNVIEFSAGYSMVLGNYAKDAWSNTKSGYAANGWMAQLTYNRMGKRDFGMAFQYTYQRNPLKNAANEVYPNGIPDSVNSRSWSNHYLMTGLVYLKTIGKIHIDAKVLGGLIVSSGSIFDTPNNMDTAKIKTDENLGTGFAYQISAGAGYHISQHVAFKFNLSLMGGWPVMNKKYGLVLIGYRSYKDPDGKWYTVPVYTGGAEYAIKKVVATLNPSLSLIYRF